MHFCLVFISSLYTYATITVMKWEAYWRRRSLKHDFSRFVVVGCLGFGINLLILSICYKMLGWPIFWSQLLGSELALFSNFILHHNWTYQGHNSQKSIKRLLIEFHTTSWMAIIGTTVLVSVGVDVLKLHYILALVIASLIALGWNFGWTRFYIWQRHQPNVLKDS